MTVSPAIIPRKLAISGRFVISLQSVTGLTYSLKYTTNIITPLAAWNTLTSTPGTGGMLNLTNQIPSDPQRFYRVQIQ